MVVRVVDGRSGDAVFTGVVREGRQAMWVVGGRTYIGSGKGWHGTVRMVAASWKNTRATGRDGGRGMVGWPEEG